MRVEAVYNAYVCAESVETFCLTIMTNQYETAIVGAVAAGCVVEWCSDQFGATREAVDYVVCESRSNNPSLKRPIGLAAPE